MISVVIQTLNSGEFIRQCLDSVKDFDEIIVCDMYSDDNTLDIAKEYNTKIVMHNRCNGIVEPARNFALNQATKDWIFVIDSDEVVPPELKDYLYRIIKTDNCPDALFIPRKNYFMNRYMRASFPDYQLRFIRKSRFIEWPKTIHSHPVIEGVIKKVPPKKEFAFIHLEKNGISPTAAKINKYSDQEVERRKYKKETIVGLLFKPTYRFFRAYILKRGFLDGKEGFIYATMRAYYKYLTIAKIIENQKLDFENK